MTSKLTSEERNHLIRAAEDVAEKAYAEYSGFRVGAAVLGARGTYTGVNVENASYPLGLCAERAALAAAISTGDRELKGIAIACIDASGGDIQEVMPCGACRQWLAELSPEAEVIVCASDLNQSFLVEDLLPLAFRLRKHHQ